MKTKQNPSKWLVKSVLVLVALGLIIAGSILAINLIQQRPSESEGAICTMDAKICPDGSAVGRTGPNCEFQACPGEPDATKNQTD